MLVRLDDVVYFAVPQIDLHDTSLAMLVLYDGNYLLIAQAHWISSLAANDLHLFPCKVDALLSGVCP